jgi:hypothetical protein
MGLSTVRIGAAPVCTQIAAGTGRSVSKKGGQQAPTGAAQLFDALAQHFRAAKKKKFSLRVRARHLRFTTRICIQG